MNLDSLTAIAGSTSLLNLSLAVLGFAWIRWRTGSSHPLNMRIWRIMTGANKVTHPRIRRYIEDQDSLMAFRVSSGMQVNSIESACRAMEFVAQHDLPADLLRAAGDYFDPHQLQMAKNPSGGIAARHFFTAGLLGLTVMLALAMSSEQRILVSLKKTSTWIWLSVEDATLAAPKLFGSRETITFSECPAPSVSNWSAQDIEIICAIRSDPALRTYIERTRRTQKSVFLVVAALLALLCASQWMAYRKDISALELVKQLEAKDLAQPPVHAALASFETPNT